MKNTIIVLIFLLFSSSYVLSQHFYEMAHANLPSKTIVRKDGTKKEIECNSFTLPKRVILPLVGKGVTDYAHIDELVISHNDESSANIKLVITVCPKFFDSKPQPYYISLMFYDKNREQLFGHTFVSDFGEKKYDVHTGLQATSMTAIEYPDCFSLVGEDVIAVHHNFLEDPTPIEDSDPLEEKAESIAFVNIRLLMLGTR